MGRISWAVTTRKDAAPLLSERKLDRQGRLWNGPTAGLSTPPGNAVHIARFPLSHSHDGSETIAGRKCSSPRPRPDRDNGLSPNRYVKIRGTQGHQDRIVHPAPSNQNHAQNGKDANAPLPLRGPTVASGTQQ